MEQQSEENLDLKVQLSKLQSKLELMESSHMHLKDAHRHLKRSYDRQIDSKNEEIKQLGETVDKILDRERKNPLGTSKIENLKVTSGSENNVSEIEKANAHLKEQLRCYESNGGTSRETLLQRENGDLREKLTAKDDTIAHLMQELKTMKQKGYEIDGSSHYRKDVRCRKGQSSGESPKTPAGRAKRAIVDLAKRPISPGRISLW